MLLRTLTSPSLTDRDEAETPMTYDSDLRLEVQQDERRIIVTMPGTPYGREFRLAEDGLVAASDYVPDEPQAPITAQEFVARAEAAAMQKALELGWCEKQPAPSPEQVIIAGLEDNREDEIK